MFVLGRLLRVIFKLVRLLPLSFRISLGRVCGWLFSYVPTQDRRIARLQMDYFLRKEGGSSHLGAMYAHLGQTALESLNLNPYLTDPDRYISCISPKLLEYMTEQRGPVLALSAHTSNWDLLAAYVVRNGARLSCVGREARNPIFHRELVRLREGYGIETIWRSEKSAARKIIEKFKSSGIVAALLDQDTKVESEFVPFFGVPAKSPAGLIRLAKKCEVKILVIFIFRTGFREYVVNIDEIDNSLPVIEILHRYNELLESAIRRHPSQWVWVHKRWRTTPDGRTMHSYSYLEYLARGLKHEHI